MVQNWIDLVFLHWRYPVDTVAKLLPEGIEVETKNFADEVAEQLK